MSTVYVSSKGNDETGQINSITKPFLTISRALKVLLHDISRARSRLTDGTVIINDNGIYVDSPGVIIPYGSITIKPQNSSSNGIPIYYTSFKILNNARLTLQNINLNSLPQSPLFTVIDLGKVVLNDCSIYCNNQQFANGNTQNVQQNGLGQQGSITSNNTSFIGNGISVDDNAWFSDINLNLNNCKIIINITLKNGFSALFENVTGHINDSSIIVSQNIGSFYLVLGIQNDYYGPLSLVNNNFVFEVAPNSDVNQLVLTQGGNVIIDQLYITLNNFNPDNIIVRSVLKGGSNLSGPTITNLDVMPQGRLKAILLNDSLIKCKRKICSLPIESMTDDDIQYYNSDGNSESESESQSISESISSFPIDQYVKQDKVFINNNCDSSSNLEGPGGKISNAIDRYLVNISKKVNSTLKVDKEKYKMDSGIKAKPLTVKINDSNVGSSIPSSIPSSMTSSNAVKINNHVKPIINNQYQNKSQHQDKNNIELTSQCNSTPKWDDSYESISEKMEGRLIKSCCKEHSKFTLSYYDNNIICDSHDSPLTIIIPEIEDESKQFDIYVLDNIGHPITILNNDDNITTIFLDEAGSKGTYNGTTEPIKRCTIKRRRNKWVMVK